MTPVQSFTTVAAILMLTASPVAAAPDLTYHGPGSSVDAPHDQIVLHTTLPSLRCGGTGEPPHSCRLSGTLQARGPENLNGLQRYTCVVRYSYTEHEGAGFRVSFKNEETTPQLAHPIKPGVAPQEKSRQGHELQYGKPAAQEEVVRRQANAYQQGSLMLTNGRGSLDLGATAPLVLPEQVRQVMLVELACNPD